MLQESRKRDEPREQLGQLGHADREGEAPAEPSYLRRYAKCDEAGACVNTFFPLVFFSLEASADLKLGLGFQGA